MHLEETFQTLRQILRVYPDAGIVFPGCSGFTSLARGFAQEQWIVYFNGNADPYHRFLAHLTRLYDSFASDFKGRVSLTQNIGFGASLECIHVFGANAGHQDLPVDSMLPAPNGGQAAGINKSGGFRAGIIPLVTTPINGPPKGSGSIAWLPAKQLSTFDTSVQALRDAVIGGGLLSRYSAKEVARADAVMSAVDGNTPFQSQQSFQSESSIEFSNVGPTSLSPENEELGLAEPRRTSVSEHVIALEEDSTNYISSNSSVATSDSDMEISSLARVKTRQRRAARILCMHTSLEGHSLVEVGSKSPPDPDPDTAAAPPPPIPPTAMGSDSEEC